MFRGLVKTADIIVYNGVDRQLRKLGIDAESLKAENQRVVICRVSAFGGPYPGPRSDEPGYDECAQSLSGLSVRNGGSLDTAEETASVGCIDNLCGFLGSCAVMLGLLEREGVEREWGSDGPIQVETSLIATAQALQLPYLFQYGERPPFDEPAGPAVLGEHALNRLYATADGWLFLAATARRCDALLAQPEFADSATPSPGPVPADSPCTGHRVDPRSGDEALAARLEAGLRRRSTDEWVRRDCYGQWNVVTTQGERFYAASYTEGVLLEWDPAKEWVGTDKNKPESNPRYLQQTYAHPGVGRPYTILAHPDGRHVIYGGTPGRPSARTRTYWSE